MINTLNPKRGVSVMVRVGFSVTVRVSVIDTIVNSVSC